MASAKRKYKVLVLFDTAGNILVSSRDTKEILRYGPDGKLDKKLAVKGQEQARNGGLTGVLLAPFGPVLALDGAPARVLRLDLDRRHQATYATLGDLPACGPSGSADGCEADLSVPERCGGCAIGCAPGQLCALSGETFACAGECPRTTRMCGTSCVDVMRDPSHCGNCDQPCAEREICSAGSCACEPFFADWRVNLEPPSQGASADSNRPVIVMMGAVALVLLVACANVAGLQFARAFESVKAIYDKLGIGQRAVYSIFEGPHEIHGVEAFKFFDRWLKENRRLGGACARATQRRQDHPAKCQLHWPGKQGVRTARSTRLSVVRARFDEQGRHGARFISP